MKNLCTRAHEFVKPALGLGAVVVDATMGNGNDTAFLASSGARVFAFDIQPAALEKTKTRLEQLGLLDGVDLILDGHENVDKYVESPVAAAMFNLGYLPSSDKKITTLPSTTVVALEKLTRMMAVGGRISILVYVGHEGGERERDAVLGFANNLCKSKWEVVVEQNPNPLMPIFVGLFAHN